MKKMLLKGVGFGFFVIFRPNTGVVASLFLSIGSRGAVLIVSGVEKWLELRPHFFDGFTKSVPAHQ